MRGKNESITLFMSAMDVTHSESFLDAFNRRHPDTHATPSSWCYGP
jgi:hypothetical protein